MRKQTLFFGAVLLITAANAQVTFKTIYGTAFCDEPKAIAHSAQGGYAMAGVTTAHDHNMNYQLLVTDSIGDTLWTREYDTGGADYLQDMKHTADGGYVMVGFTDNPSTFTGTDITVIKVDASGIVQWYTSCVVSSTSSEYPEEIIQTSDGGYVVVGRADTNFLNLAFAVKLDAGGAVQWSKRYTTAGLNVTWLESVAEAPNGDLVMTGFANVNSVLRVFVLKTDSNGNLIWNTIVSDTNDLMGLAVVLNATGDIFIGESQGILIKLNSLGVTQWVRQYQANFIGITLRSLIINSQGDICMVGSGSAPTDGGLFMIVDPNGNCYGGWNYPQHKVYSYVDIIQASDGGYAIVAEIDSAFGVLDTASYLLIKTLPNQMTQCGVYGYAISTLSLTLSDSTLALQTLNGGTTVLTPMGYASGLNIIPACPLAGIEETTMQNEISIYPQPVQSQFAIELNAEAVASDRELILINSLGQEVLRQTLLSDKEIIFCAELAPGIYFYTLLSDGKLIGSGKMVKE